MVYPHATRDVSVTRSRVTLWTGRQPEVAARDVTTLDLAGLLSAGIKACMKTRGSAGSLRPATVLPLVVVGGSQVCLC